jgi:hypothetical protein
LQNDIDAKNIDVQQLRNELHQAGQVLEMPDVVADTSREGWMNNLPKISRPA